MAEKFQYPAGSQIPGTKYRVIRLLGAGGMGTVYEVEDTTIDKRYVLKTLHATLSSRKDLVERMQREAKALAKLEHRNIVQVITADVTGDSLRLPYFVMQKLSGHTLRTVLDHKGKLEIDAAVRLIIDVLNALYHAHENGIIHRDVKPDNIFLHRDPDGLTVPKLLDFGVMATTEAVTVTGQRFIGTLRYAAPEQLLGEKVSPQTDLYAAALVLYECLAGRGPFEDEGDAMKVARAHIDKAPPLLSMYRSVPPALERIVMKSLAKPPEERHADAFMLAAELHRFLRELRGSLPPDAATSASTVSDVMQLPAPAVLKEAVPRPSEATTKDKRPSSSRTRIEGHAGATVPASELPTPRLQPVDGELTPASEPLLVGDTIEEERAPTMTLGEMREAYRAKQNEATVRAASPVVDRNAPTGTMQRPIVRDGETELIESMVSEGLAHAGTPPARNVKRASEGRIVAASGTRSSRPPPSGKDTSLPGSTSRTVSEAAAAKPAMGRERVVAIVMGGIAAVSVAAAVGFGVARRGTGAAGSAALAPISASAPATTTTTPAAVPPVGQPSAAVATSTANPSGSATTERARNKTRATEAKPAIETKAKTEESAPRRRLPGSGL